MKNINYDILSARIAAATLPAFGSASFDIAGVFLSFFSVPEFLDSCSGELNVLILTLPPTNPFTPKFLL